MSETKTSQSTVSFLHFNDAYEAEYAPGFLTALKSASKGCPSQPIITFGGDAFSPSLMSSWTHGAHMMRVLNVIQPDVAVLGNHEFDVGLVQLEELVYLSDFPWLCSNAQLNHRPVDQGHGHCNKGHLRSDVSIIGDDNSLQGFGTHKYCIVQKDLNGPKVGFIGLIQEDWLSAIRCLTPGLVKSQSHVEAARTGVQVLKEIHRCDVVVALTHMSLPADEELAAAVPELDVILAGHDHFYRVVQAKDSSQTASIIKGGADFDHITRVVLTRPEASSPWAVTIESIPTRCEGKELYPKDPELQTLLSWYTQRQELFMRKVVGRTLVPLDARKTPIRRGETACGSFISDALRQYFHADVALVNAGSIRGGTVIPRGELTVADLIKLYPGDDIGVVAAVSGRQLREALENAVAPYHLQKPDGRFAQVSGLRFAFDPSRESKQRVMQVLVSTPGFSSVTCTDPLSGDAKIQGIHLSPREGEFALNDNAFYRVACTEYLHQGKEGYSCLTTAPLLVDAEHGVLVPQLLRHFFDRIHILESLGFAQHIEPAFREGLWGRAQRGLYKQGLLQYTIKHGIKPVVSDRIVNLS